jgi:hypothetical protein
MTPERRCEQAIPADQKGRLDAMLTPLLVTSQSRSIELQSPPSASTMCLRSPPSDSTSKSVTTFVETPMAATAVMAAGTARVPLRLYPGCPLLLDAGRRRHHVVREAPRRATAASAAACLPARPVRAQARCDSG